MTDEKVLRISVTLTDIDTVRDALIAARTALRMHDQACRYHGTDWIMSRWGSDVPQCESCRKPYAVVKALEALKEVME